MIKSVTIQDQDYYRWVKDLAKRYRCSQVKAALKVNAEKLLFNWQLGRDIVEMHVEERWGDRVVVQLCADLQKELPGVEGLSRSNLYYCKKFYSLYRELDINVQQVVGQNLSNENVQQLAGVFQIPWGHHCVIKDKVNGDMDKALFFVRKTLSENWSRGVLLSWISTDLYEREGKAISNFNITLPEPMSDLAQEITKDPYNFAFAGVRGQYNEKILKEALLKNISNFLMELGTGFAYVGKEFRLQIGEKEKFVDLLFFHIPLNCYVVIEVKIGEFDSADIGQLGTYVVACNHVLKSESHNPTIGLLVCKNKDNTLARYALESSTQPIGISEFDLSKLYPEKVEGMVPSVEELEAKLQYDMQNEESAKK